MIAKDIVRAIGKSGVCLCWCCRTEQTGGGEVERKWCQKA
jgi:hypothetical protein